MRQAIADLHVNLREPGSVWSAIGAALVGAVRAVGVGVGADGLGRRALVSRGTPVMDDAVCGGVRDNGTRYGACCGVSVVADLVYAYVEASADYD